MMMTKLDYSGYRVSMTQAVSMLNSVRRDLTADAVDGVSIGPAQETELLKLNDQAFSHLMEIKDALRELKLNGV